MECDDVSRLLQRTYYCILISGLTRLVGTILTADADSWEKDKVEHFAIASTK